MALKWYFSHCQNWDGTVDSFWLTGDSHEHQNGIAPLSTRATDVCRAVSFPARGCWVHEQLFREWKDLVRSEPKTSGWNSLAVWALWIISEHRMGCEVCRKGTSDETFSPSRKI
jgi:hypothetical protein